MPDKKRGVPSEGTNYQDNVFFSFEPTANWEKVSAVMLTSCKEIVAWACCVILVRANSRILSDGQRRKEPTSNPARFHPSVEPWSIWRSASSMMGNMINTEASAPSRSNNLVRCRTHSTIWQVKPTVAEYKFNSALNEKWISLKVRVRHSFWRWKCFSLFSAKISTD